MRDDRDLPRSAAQPERPRGVSLRGVPLRGGHRVISLCREPTTKTGPPNRHPRSGFLLFIAPRPQCDNIGDCAGGGRTTR